MELNGSQIVIECLKEQGVDTVFGYPGGTILNIYDEMYKHSDEITHILVSHEQGAAHAADGYARSTGKVGVCMATSGPGATNLVTGIATAYMDSVPLVAITANVAKSGLGKDSFQEIDIVGATMPITKHNFIVKDIENLADTIRKAFRIAKTGRPGPVLVDITKDVTANKYNYEKQEPVKVERISDTIKKENIDIVVEMIKSSKKPFILVGGGAVISDAAKEVRELAELVDAPVCDSLMGKGAMDAYGGLVLMVCYDAIRIFRRVFRASIIRVIVEDVIFWTVAALFIFQMFFKYNYGRPRYYGVIAVLGTMALFEWLVGKRVVEKCAVILTKIMKTLLKPLKKLKKVITIKSKSILTKHKRRKNSHTNKNTKNKKTDKRQKESTYKKSKSQKKTG